MELNFLELTNTIKKIVADLLRIPEDNLKENIELHEYGLSSLAALALVQKLKKQFNCYFSLEDLVNNSSIELISKVILERSQITV